MQKDPTARIPSAKALADDLQRWLAGQPIHSRKTSWVQRQPRLVALAFALALGLLAIFLTSLPKPTPTPTPSSSRSTATNKIAYIPTKFVMETFSIDGARQGPRFYIGWGGTYHGVISEFAANQSNRGTYIFQLQREDLEDGIALKVLNYHLAKEGKDYYLPNLTHEPTVYQVTDPLWAENDLSTSETNIEFLSFIHQERYLRHSGRMLHHHGSYNGDSEKGQRIFQQDATWAVHQIR